MSRYGEAVLDQLESFVEQVESGTSAEVVMVLAHRSERYLDVPFKVGCLAALATLAVLVYVPLDFMAELMLIDVMLAFALGYALGRFSPWLPRILTTRKRRQASVTRAARAVFNERGVSLTRERTGILVYISWLERRVEVLVDIGVERCVPQDRLNAALRQFLTSEPLLNFPMGLTAAFSPVRAVFDEFMPRPEDDTDEIPNRPVVLA